MNACMYILNRHMHIVWTNVGSEKIKRGKRRAHLPPWVEDEGNPPPTVQEGHGHGRAAASRERLKGDGASAGPRRGDATEGLRRVGRRGHGARRGEARWPHGQAAGRRGFVAIWRRRYRGGARRREARQRVGRRGRQAAVHRGRGAIWWRRWRGAVRRREAPWPEARRRRGAIWWHRCRGTARRRGRRGRPPVLAGAGVGTLGV
jgi:hypothetical protein